MSGLRLAAMFVAASLSAGCGGPELMIASSIAQAAIETGVEEAHRAPPPSPDDAWRDEQLALLVARARAGEPANQYLLALYYAAAGDARAYPWMCRAALRNYPRAQLQLGHWYNEDRLREDLWPYLAVAPDDSRALYWYRLARAHGEAAAVPFQERVSARGARAPVAFTPDCGRLRTVQSTLALDAPAVGANPDGN